MNVKELNLISSTWTEPPINRAEQTRFGCHHPQQCTHDYDIELTFFFFFWRNRVDYNKCEGSAIAVKS